MHRSAKLLFDNFRELKFSFRGILQFYSNSAPIKVEKKKETNDFYTVASTFIERW